VLEIPPLRILRLQAEQDVEVEINGALGSRLRLAIAYAIAGVGYVFLTALQYLSRQLFLDTADDPFALLWASIYGIQPNAATAAQGTVKATGVAGSVFAGGEVLRTADGREYTVDAPAVMGPTQEILLTVTASEAGDAGNVDPGVIMSFVSPPAGIDTPATVIGGITDGFDAETTASVKDRTLELIRAPRRGGSEEDYQIWAREVPGVAAAYARGSYAGIGTVLLIIAQEWDPTDPGDSPIPSAALIGDVEAYIETRKPAGLYLVAVQPPVLQPLDPYLVLEPDTPDIRTAVERSLALALADVEPDGIAYYDDLVIAIDRAAGEVHHRLFVDDGLGVYGPYDTQVGANSLIVPGTITWTEPP